MKHMEKFITTTRVAFTVFLLFRAYEEAGIYTAICLCLIFITTESQALINKTLKLRIERIDDR